MRSYSNYSVRDLLDAFSSTAPAPGGGAAAALTGALGVSLLLMAAGIRSSRATEPVDSSELAESTDKLRSLRPAIESLVDRDAEAYTSVITALRLPADPGDRRKQAIDAAMRTATDVPLDIMRAARRALREAPAIAAHSVRSTHGDVAVAIELLRAAVRSAGFTIDANLVTMKDAEYASLVRDERQRLDAESTADAESALSMVRSG
jgi:formiminotetrahydrofolate cyclodeaminase